MTYRKCYRILGLEPGATPGEIRAAFRRLAKRQHPDVARTPAATRRFVRTVTAYRMLIEHLDAAADIQRGHCRWCGHHAALLRLPDGRRGCADCLLGLTARRHLLSGPAVTVARHIAVVVLYVVGLVLIGRYASTGSPREAVAGLLAIWCGFGLLAYQVLSITLDTRRLCPQTRGHRRSHQRPRR